MGSKKETGSKKEMGSKKETILINAFPRSGSSYLREMILRLTDFKRVPLIYQYGSTEQNLYLPAVTDALSSDTVSQHHFCATDSNVFLLKEFHISPIILVRNIFDVVVSNKEVVIKHLKAAAKDYFAGYSTTGYFNESYLEMDEVTQYDYSIDMSAAWYIHFFVSWYETARRSNIKTFWTTYDKVVNDSQNVLKKISKFYQLDINEEKFDPVIQGTKSPNLNVGISGRGEQILSADQKDRIRRYCKYFPDTDFSMIGLGDH